MSHRVAAWLAWSLWALCVALFALTMVLLFLSPPIPTGSPSQASDPLIVVFRLMALIFPTVGAFVASRRPKNSIGWIFCGTGLLTSVRSFAEAYADYALLARPGSLPGGEYMAWLASWLGLPVVALGVPLVLLVFPDGKLLDRLWWIVVWVAAGGAALLALDWALWPGATLTTHPSIENPFGLAPEGVSLTILASLSGFGPLFLAVGWVGAAVALIVRIEKASRLERQQIKWLVYATALMGVSFVASVAGSRNEYWDPVWVLVLVGIAAFNCFPIAVGIAILRYRLYDIDLLINRTLVYGALTGILALVYLGGVVVLQALFRYLTGQDSQLAIVASTLAIAALFGPLRRRIQAFIDRRFYRRKYDVTKTLEAFSAKLRDETDLDALRADLVGVVGETMQPAHVSLWLRPAGEPKAKSAQAIADSVGPITMPPEKEHQRGEGTLGGATRRTRVNRRGLWAACVVLILLIGGVGALTTVGTVGAGCAKDKDSARAKCCSEATLNGRYLLAFDGFIVEGDEKVPFTVANFQVFDGNGNAKGVSSFSVNGKITRREPFSATYTVKANCTGTITVDANVLTHYDFFTAPDGTMITFVQTNPGVVAAGSQLRGTAKRVGE